MKQAKISMYVQIAYMVSMGIGFLFLPNLILPLFGFSAPTDVWIRVLGALALTLSSYYYPLTENEVLVFYKASIWGRYGFCACLAVLAFFKFAEAPLYFFAILETLLAIWTHISLRKENLM
jgi:hypothetical protein